MASLEQCREKDLTFARPLTVTVAFINRETGEIREQSVFMGDFPWMTERGTFVINGTERVVVTQLVRSPGAYLMEPKDREKQVFIANLMPARGSWLELEIDKKGKVYVRIDRKRKLPVTVLLRAMGYATDEEILRLFENSLYIRNTLESDTEPTRTEEGALIELFKKQRPGEPPWVETPARCSTSCSSTPSATTSRASAATSSTRASASTSTSTRARSPTTTSSRWSGSSSRCPSAWACPRIPRSRSRTTPPRRPRCRASRSPSTSTSTSTSATAACAPSAS